MLDLHWVMLSFYFPMENLDMDMRNFMTLFINK